MIIYRYLSRQLLWTTVSVSVVLTMILVFGRFIKYLADVASGRLAGDVVFLIMAYRLPDFLELILPLGLFLGVLLAYGRMYLENEMVILEASGLSSMRLVMWTMLPALGMATLVGMLSLYLGPLGGTEYVLLEKEQKKRAGLEVLMPGRFNVSNDGATMTYTEGLSDDKSEMERLFIIVHENGDDRSSEAGFQDHITLIRADSGRYLFENNNDSKARYLELSGGYRYKVTPGDAELGALSYGVYKMKVEDRKVSAAGEAKYDYRPTLELFSEGSLEANAELAWRFSLVLLVPVIVFLAVPLSRVNPRQGRYLKLLPAIFLYLSYLMLLITVRDAIANGGVGLLMIWVVHGVFFGLAILLLKWPELKFRWASRLEAAGAKS